ncbi:hypothetical protein [Sulfitobacter sp.]|uniref:hypothetical protein n=1 Tax=Sulfitobacter sp. TaxID=1903071 RepID=UPI003F6C3811
MTTLNAALAAAQQAQLTAMKLHAELAAVKSPTLAETDDRDAIGALMVSVNDAPAAIKAGQLMIFEAIDMVSELSYEWTAWANEHHAAIAATAVFQAIAGFASSEADHAKFTTVSQADMIRVGPSLVLDPYTGAALPPTTVNGDAAVVDMKHITERHVRSTYEFDEHSSPKGSEHDLGVLLRGQLADKDISPEEKRLIQESQRAKPNSFFPEEVTALNAAGLAKTAMEQAQANVSPDTVGNILTDQIQPFGALKKWASALHQGDAIALNIPPAVSATIGIALNVDPINRTTSPHTKKPPPQVLKARMFIPTMAISCPRPTFWCLPKHLVCRADLTQQGT